MSYSDGPETALPLSADMCRILGQSLTAPFVAPSGARSSEQAPRFDLIPLVAIEREAQRMAEGAAAHGENNYQKGKGDPVYIRERTNHLIRHALLYAAGDTSTDHLSAIRCNAAMLMVLTEG